MPSSLSTSSSPPPSSHRARQQPGSVYSDRKSGESVASDAVYTSHYTSSFAREDLLVARIVWLRDKAQGLFRRASRAATAPVFAIAAQQQQQQQQQQQHHHHHHHHHRRSREPKGRGRPRYRDWEYY